MPVLAVNDGLVMGVRRGLAVGVSGLADAGAPHALPLRVGHGSEGVAALVHVMRAPGGHNSTVHVHVMATSSWSTFKKMSRSTPGPASDRERVDDVREVVDLPAAEDQGFDACVEFLGRLDDVGGVARGVEHLLPPQCLLPRQLHPGGTGTVHR